MIPVKLLFSIWVLTILYVPGIFLNHNLEDSDNWTHFRGNRLNGISENSSPLIIWGNDSNVIWKSSVHGKGWSSPVVYDNQVWLTTASIDGKQMNAIAIDYNSGKTVFDINLFNPDTIYRKHDINSYATPTPCIEKNFVYVHFGRYGTACINTTTGLEVWRRTDLECKHIQGPGSSPILYKNLIILHYEGTEKQYIVALSKKTGETIWKTERPADLYRSLLPIGRKAYITPLVINVEGRDLLISNGSAVCIAYDVNTGKEVWRFIQGEDSTIAMPFYEDGTLYFYTSFITPKDGKKYTDLISINPKGTGDITSTHLNWRLKSPILQLSTPVIYNGFIYTVDSKSILMCINATTGQPIWSNRVKGKYNASPVYANGYLYFSSTNGKVIVIREGKEFSKVAENEMEGEIWATPAIIRNDILIRTSKFLYRIGERR